MKDLIIDALNRAYEIACNPDKVYTKQEIFSLCIDNVNPFDLPKFLSENNVPKDCWFSVYVSESGLYDADTINVSYNITVSMTDAEILKAKEKSFERFAWKYVYNYLISNGYKRKGFDSSLLSKFDGTSIYSMYMRKDFDMLVKYYSLYFKKEIDKSLV